VNTCRHCGSPATHKVGLFADMNKVCEPCADAMIACPHESGTRRQEYDADGFGYYVWTCDDCWYEMVDCLP
jgi:hypothetical protein